MKIHQIIFMKLNNMPVFIAISILGLLSIILPVFILPDLKPYESPLFPLIRTGIEGVSIYSLGFLFFSGFIVKLFSKISFWKIGLMSMVLFPLGDNTIVEIMAIIRKQDL